jgi:hypothetical protein
MRKWLQRRCARQGCKARRAVGRYCLPCAAAFDGDPWRG